MIPVFNTALVHVTKEMIVETFPVVGVKTTQTDGREKSELMIVYGTEVIHASHQVASYPDDYFCVIQGIVNIREEKSNALAFYNNFKRSR